MVINNTSKSIHLIISCSILLALLGYPAHSFEVGKTFEGVVKQPGYGYYPVNINIVDTSLGKKAATVNYPSFPCSSYLTLKQKGKEWEFVENVEVGKDRCTDKGSVRILELDNNRISVSWFSPNGKPETSGVLQDRDVKKKIELYKKSSFPSEELIIDNFFKIKKCSNEKVFDKVIGKFEVRNGVWQLYYYNIDTGKQNIHLNDNIRIIKLDTDIWIMECGESGSKGSGVLEEVK
jgi:hypothetical protein